MRPKRSEKEIINESGSSSRGGRGISPGFCTIHQKHSSERIQIQSQLSSQIQQQKSIQTLTRLQILPTSPNPPASPPPPPPPPPTPTLLTHHQPHFHFHYDQPIFSDQHSTKQKPLLSAPHKRPSAMTLSPPSSSLSHSPTLSSLRSHHQSNFCTENKVNGKPFTCIISIKTLAYKLFCHLSHARLLCVHLRVLVLISLPSLYFFLSNPHRFFILNLLYVLAFLITLLVSLNLALPRLPSIRFLLARSLPRNFKSTPLPTNTSKPVIWSIGSKPKVDKKLNSGSWVQVYSNGDVYEGEFHKGKCSGSGVYYYYMSGRYEGDWIDEKYDGYGVETWARGSRYRGQYRQGLRHGIGVYRFYTGDVYAGEWSNGQCHGCGIHTCEDGSRYVGEFKWGVKHGLGHYHFRNGDTYAGEYFADKMHGFGVYQFGNGHRYEGAWHEGRRQGLGMYTFRNGEAQSGHWQNGVLDVPSLENSLPGSPYVVSHSKVINAVQEAQRAAEKAYGVAKIDERVNRTVAAANKAANAARVAAVKAVQRQMPHNNSHDAPNPFV